MRELINKIQVLTAAVNNFNPSLTVDLTGPITALDGVTSIGSQTGTGSTFAMSASPTFTGTPLAPTATLGTNTTQIATTAFVIANAAGLFTDGGAYTYLTSTTDNLLLGSTTLPAVFNTFKLNAIAGSGERGIYTRNSVSTIQSEVLVENNRNDASNYFRLYLGGSAMSAPGTNLFGLATADLAVLQAGGGNNLGLAIGTNENVPVIFATSSLERMRILGNGNVAIGSTTSTFDSRLAVVSATLRTGYFQGTDASTYTSVLMENDRGGAASYLSTRYGSSASGTTIYGMNIADMATISAEGANNLGMIVGTGSATPLYLGTNNTVKANITSAGNLSIGNGSSDLGARFGNKGSGATSGTFNQRNYNSSSTLLFQLDDAGQALFGTALPSVFTASKLNVIGTSALRGIYTRNVTSTSYSEMVVESNRDDASNYARLLVGGSAAPSPATDLCGVPMADMTFLDVGGTNSQGLVLGVFPNKPIKIATNNTVRAMWNGAGQMITGSTTTLPAVFSTFQLNVIGAGSGQRGIYTRNTDASFLSEVLVENDRNDAGSYLRNVVGGTTSVATIFGLTVADFAFSEAGGTNNLGYAVGTSAAKPLYFATNNTVKTKITSAGSLVHGTAALATNATDGFLYIPTCAGTPTGVPTAQTGTVAIIFDTTNNKLMIYDGGWLGATTPGAFV